MLTYMAIPVLIMFGVCILFYMLGRYVRIGKSQKPKEPDRVPILEEENRILKESLEIKSKELEKKNEAYDLVLQEHQKLLAQTPSESTDKIDGKEKETEDVIKSEEPIKIEPYTSEPEKAPPAIDPSIHTVSSLYESVLKGPEEKPEGEKPEEKVESEKPEKKEKRKKPKAKAKPKPRKKKK